MYLGVTEYRPPKIEGRPCISFMPIAKLARNSQPHINTIVTAIETTTKMPHPMRMLVFHPRCLPESFVRALPCLLIAIEHTPST